METNQTYRNSRSAGVTIYAFENLLESIVAQIRAIEGRLPIHSNKTHTAQRKEDHVL